MARVGLARVLDEDRLAVGGIPFRPPAATRCFLSPVNVETPHAVPLLTVFFVLPLGRDVEVVGGRARAASHSPGVVQPEGISA